MIFWFYSKVSKGHTLPVSPVLVRLVGAAGLEGEV